jgi:hypothetical protein
MLLGPKVHLKYYQKIYQVIPFYFLNFTNNLVLDHASIIFHIQPQDEETTQQITATNHSTETHAE